MASGEYSAYSGCANATTSTAQVQACEAYLSAYPQSAVKAYVLQRILIAYSKIPSTDKAKALNTADRLLQVQPNNLRSITIEVFFHRQNAEAASDANTKQAEFDQAAVYAARGLAATRPDYMSAADFETVRNAVTPTLYSAIAAAATAKKNWTTAIYNYKQELSSVAVVQTTQGQLLQDTYQLGAAYYQSTPPDFVNCTWYTSRASAFAPEPYKTDFLKVASYCYKTYHGNADGYDTVLTAVRSSLNPPPNFSIPHVATPADIAASAVSSTANLATLSLEDQEFILENGRTRDRSKVWQAMLGRTYRVNDVKVIASSPTGLELAVSEDAVQKNVPDFRVVLASTATAQIPAVNSTVSFTGTYSAYSQHPITITMTNASVISATDYAAPSAVDLAKQNGVSRTITVGIASSNAPAALKIPHNYALFFAGNKYDVWKALTNPVPDAQALADTLHSLYGFQTEVVSNASDAEIIAKLSDYLHRGFQPEDQLLIFFAGHGYYDFDLGEGFIVPSNAPKLADDPGHRHMISHQDIMRYVDRFTATHVVLIMDACFAGALDRKTADNGLRGDADYYSHIPLSELIARKEAKRTRRYFTSGGIEFVPDGVPGHHSPFVSALLLTLNQAADRKGYVTLDDLQSGLDLVSPEPRWGDIENENEPGADFILLTPHTVQLLTTQR